MCDFCQLYYNKDTNTITDDMGDLVFNIFDYVTPNELLIFKLKRQDILANSRYGQLVELIYEK